MEGNEEQGFIPLDEIDRPNKRQPPRWELLIGLALLLIVGGWGSWEWWQQQTKFRDYRAAQQHAAANDWDAAHRAYLAAQGYADADERAAEAAGKIAERDSRYQAGRGNLERGLSAAALRDLRVVAEIQPGFKDSGILLGEAEQQVYQAALSGTIALRTGVEPPGLYVYRAGGWQYLQGSDVASRLRAYGPVNSCCILYDAPVPGTTPARVRPTMTPRGEALSARRLVVARLEESGLNFQALELGLVSQGTYVPYSEGVLALRYDRRSSTTRDPRVQQVASPFSTAEVVLQAAGRSVTETLTLPGAPWALLNVGGFAGLTMVLGDYTLASGESPQTDLYLTRPGGEMRFIARREALVHYAMWALDERHLVLFESVPHPGSETEEQRIVVVPLADGSPATVLAHRQEEMVRRSSISLWNFWFVPHGAYRGMVWISDSHWPQDRVQLFNLDRPAQPIWVGEGDPDETFERVVSLDQGLLFLWNGLRLREGQVIGNTAFYLDASGRSQQIEVASRGRLPSLAVGRGEYIVAVSWDGAASDPAGAPQTIHSYGLKGFLSGEAAPVELFSHDGAELGPANYWERSWYLGGGMLAYIKGGELYGRTYDGVVELLLEPGVQLLYDFSY